MCRHSHERHSVVSLSSAVAGADGPFGCEPHTSGRARVPCDRGEGGSEDARAAVLARRRQSGVVQPARRQTAGRRRPRAVIEEIEAPVLNRLRELGIEFTRHEHPPVPTVEDALEHWAEIDAMHCKNLFLRNQKGNRHYLVIIEFSKRADLRKVADQIGDGKLSFASPERLMSHLGITPGSVSPFGLINDRDHVVRVVLDRDLKSATRVSFHPNINTVTLTIAAADFYKFLDACGNTVQYVTI